MSQSIFLSLFLPFFVLTLALTAQAQNRVRPSPGEAAFIVPARPTFSNPAEFQRPGVLQIEYGYTANFNAPDVRMHQATPLALRFAVSRRVLLEVASDSPISQTTEGGVRRTGAGDLQVGVQGVLQQERPSRPGVAVAYSLKLPTASRTKGLGTGRVDHNFSALLSQHVGANVVDFTAIFLLAGRARERGQARSGQAALAVSRTLSRRFGLQGELAGFSRNDRQAGALLGLGVVTYQATRRLVCDGGIRIGLTPEAPRVGVVGGLTIGLADLYKRDRKQSPGP